ncbi:MAG TPA: helix-turn-helix transcriptional regulator [Clostridiales bacterium]|nr:helix-turn-helix transcriptional regulator [Clostridiales bacterium]
MSNIKRYRLQNKLTQTQIAQALKAVESRISTPLFNRIEQGVVNPTPAELDALADALGCEPADLMDFAEVNYNIPSSSKDAARAKKNRQGKKNFCALIPAEMVKDLDKKLRVCGYKDRPAWMMRKLMALDVEYGKITAAHERSKKREHSRP